MNLEPTIATPDEDMQRAGEAYFKTLDAYDMTMKERMWAADGFAKGWVAKRDAK
jgi:hypothetical protein